MKYVVLIALLMVTACKEFPGLEDRDHGRGSEKADKAGKGNNSEDSGETSEPNSDLAQVSDESEIVPAEEPLSVACGSSASFLDIVEVDYSVTFNVDGTSDVTCSVLDSGNVTASHTEHYSAEQDGNSFFSRCVIYYKASQNIAFQVPGAFDAQAERPSPADAGFQITGIPGQPQNGYEYGPSYCEVQ
jgi:hypothetical protein